MALFCQAATWREAGADRLRRKSPKPHMAGRTDRKSDLSKGTTERLAYAEKAH